MAASFCTVIVEKLFSGFVLCPSQQITWPGGWWATSEAPVCLTVAPTQARVENRVCGRRGHAHAGEEANTAHRWIQHTCQTQSGVAAEKHFSLLHIKSLWSVFTLKADV